jgi:hypothetical protein
MDTRAQEVSIKTLPAPETMKFVLTSHYGVIENGKPARIQEPRRHSTVRRA